MELNNFIKYRDKTGQLIADIQKWYSDDSGTNSQSIESCQNIHERLLNKDVYLAILGEQGAGKSTLSNALLGGKDIFPVDVAETTNCMTYVMGLDKNHEEYAEIVLNDGETIKGPLEETFLRPYVDEQQNPENEKGVIKVKCYAHVDWLEKSGVCFVDTPGVESLNSRNHEITYAFLPQITVAIYLSRVTPPITGTELNFLNAIWEKSPMMFFAMNRYDESTEEVEESATYTKKALQELNEDEGALEAPDLYKINVLRAYDAYEDDDPEEIKEELIHSGVKKLTENISQALETELNKTRIQSAVNSLWFQVKSSIGALSSLLNTIKKDYNVQKDQILNDSLEKERAYRASLKELLNLGNETKTAFDNFHTEVLGGIPMRIENIQDEMEEKIDNSQMSPKHFQRQFKSICKRHLDPPFDMEEIQDVSENFIRDAGDICDQFVSKLNVISATTLKDESFSKPEGFDPDESDEEIGSDYLMKGSAYIMDAIGMLSLTGIVGGALWAGGVAWVAAGSIGGGGAAIGAAAVAMYGTLLAMGPVGWIIAGGVAFVGIAGGWQLKDWAKKREKKKLKDAIKKCLPDVKNSITEFILKSQADAPRQLDNLLEKIESKMDEELTYSINLIRELEKPIEDRQNDISQLEDRIQSGKRLLSDCQNIQQEINSLNYVERGYNETGIH
jgi:GTPase SAR1 family protein